MLEPEITDADLDQLTACAEAATQDEWLFGHSGTTTLEEACAWMSEIISHCDSPDIWGVFCGDPDKPAIPATTGNGPTSEANARYLAAVQPANVLKLITAMRRDRREIARLSRRRERNDYR